ncbi:hypothetical protein GBA52_011373 [Prunus armeniaca]|nr:hypothetical protein GBA52_011373 [Prunus armeniaca]
MQATCSTKCPNHLGWALHLLRDAPSARELALSVLVSSVASSRRKRLLDMLFKLLKITPLLENSWVRR